MTTADDLDRKIRRVPAWGAQSARQTRPALLGVLESIASALLESLHATSRAKAQRILHDHRHLNEAERSPDRVEA